mgnify:CR=1 FL=1
MVEDAATEQLLQRAGEGDQSALGQLLEQQRQRLRRMVAFRLDPRLSARLDASDVVQEALAEAAEKMADYCRRRPLPFYPWLRQIAWQRLVHQHERHVWTAKRSVNRERENNWPLSEPSAMELAQQLHARTSGPSTVMVRKEQTEKLRVALAQLRPRDREVLILKYIEQLSGHEIAAVLGINVDAVYARHVRALERIRHAVDVPPKES